MRGTASFRNPRFARYFSTVAISAFGTALTAVAIPVLVVEVLGASTFEVGLVNAAQLVPYALLGLVAGVYVDRWQRQRVLVVAGLGRAASLALIPVCWFLGGLHLWVLIVLLLLFGAFSVFGFAATQSLLPHIVERRALRAANARLDQAEAGAQTVGPGLGGLLVGFVGAPLAIAVDAVTYVLDAVLIAGLRLAPAVRRESVPRSLRHEVGEGLRWTYRHRILGPLAWSTHVWFLGNAAALTVLAVFALRTLGLTALSYGLLFAVGGIATLIGASFASTAGARFGSGATITAGRAIYPLAWTMIAFVPTGTTDQANHLAVSLLFSAFALQGLAGGLENANEMSLRQGLTPDALLGRVNGTMRSANRTMGALGAVLGGAAAVVMGERTALGIIVCVFVVAFILAVTSPLRTARDD
ncbi:MFS transporter [uncultured Arthrobacter sp.]|uniref:MFS transporter n=1 Tax=uncultured Arthrobacter sp. TaxID=114050 RepID=UPI00262C75BD|nr:MFS transporter [uncultured Arthrobacter sp.]